MKRKRSSAFSRKGRQRCPSQALSPIVPMDSSIPYDSPNMSPPSQGHVSSMNTGPPQNPDIDTESSTAQTQALDCNMYPGQPDASGDQASLRNSNVPPNKNQSYQQQNGGQPIPDEKNVLQTKVPRPPPMDLAEEIKGMYRLLDLISESGSNGCVDKVIIAQDSLKRFINAVCPGTYASITKVDFKTLDQLAIKPLGVYGSKFEIVRLLLSLKAVDENIARLLLAPTELGGHKPALSSGLYIVAAGRADPTQECYYVIYWPEDSTWDDSATSSVCRNRVTFMRYLTKMCEQVVALSSAEHSASIVRDEDSDTESMDIDASDEKRLFTYEVAKRNEQEESALSRPGFQMKSHLISRHEPSPDCFVDPSMFIPSLLHGETVQGFWTGTYVPQRARPIPLDLSWCSCLYLKRFLAENSLILSESLDENAVQILVDVALSNIFPKQCNDWHSAKSIIRERLLQEATSTERRDQVCEDLRSREASLRRALRDAVVDEVTKVFPSIERSALSSHIKDSGDSDMNHEATQLTRLDYLRQLHPRFGSIYKSHVADAQFRVVKGLQYKSLKERLIFLCHILEHQDLAPRRRTELSKALLSEGNLHHVQQVLTKSDKNKDSGMRSLYSIITSVLSRSKDPDVESLPKKMENLAGNVPDPDFLLKLQGVEDEDTKASIQETFVLVNTQLSSQVDSTVNKMTHAMLQMQQEECRKYVQREIEKEGREALSAVLVDFIREINKASAGRRPSVAHIDGVQNRRTGYGWSEYKVTGHREELEESKLEFRLHLMDITSDDRQNMQLNPEHLPNPIVRNRPSGLFHLPLGLHIIFHKLLENERLLLVVADRDKHAIYLERLLEMDAAIRRDKPIKTLNRNKMGEDALFTYDESKRMLVVYASAKMQLYAFVFDETFRTLQGQGSPVSLAPWYSQAEISILQLSSVCRSDEVVLVGSNAQVRIFSFITQQFRPASLQLPSPPSAVYPSPDGSCLLVLHAQGSRPSLIAYHWDTFGSTDGISLDIPTFPLEDTVVTSMVSRGHVFLLALNIDMQCVNSVAIDIKRKVTEVVFQAKGNRDVSSNGGPQTRHNNTLNCHRDVWTRFPVLPAVKRRTITSLSERRPKSLTFITANPTRPFASYFSDLIQGFVKATRKPTGDELRGINVSAADFESFQKKTIFDLDWNVSRYRIGEWLVDLLCLIPIHIAVCRENRFVPLADGVISAELERSLLGADVNQIVDKLSFGWYESIFQSYMASKPVKVVSSMGQQSVGKSFSLNHLVDTSFAGSAMRTTEGVWMSVTPTDDELIVALDFEGMDSVERSPQEDTLLVLFNTAISNLVLFRNNFAFGRDISGLFQSFQSSASVLDPATNPSLFQSTLVIIIKDVVESDNIEIAREFSLKFQNIVEQEQDDNFISRLHGGKLDIIPWPVIESKEFYKLFTTLKRQLDLQKISHPTAGEFLHTIKTLMAKLKANDWGTLSQTMAEHRARSLSALLPVALATGFSETEFEPEPLKDFDTDLVVDINDTMARFAVSDEDQIPPFDVERHLTVLLEAWNPTTPRQSIPDSEWVAELISYLNSLVDLRVNHVRSWLDCNVMRFQGDHAATQDLRRRFDNMVIEMKTNIRICGAQCSLCHLLCIRGRLHEGDHSCNTTHKCAHICGFCEGDAEPCGTRAGHPGKHICVVTAHLCGKPCKLLGRRGCLEGCTKVVEHAEGDHMCSALVHMCGEPCALTGIKFPGGKTYSCPERCSIPSDQVHETHSCDTRLCPSTCELCKRLCDKQHLHGLTPGTHHLCGEAHSCSALCSNKGICQIDSAPQSIEATFTGRHETFQYTKYTQVAKRLQCISTILPGQTSHEGPHTHSKQSQPFHFCEARCENCSYFCTLPLGHAQPEHETSHGSMTQTRWAVDGPDGTSLELGGRKFSANDEGAPMMCNLVCSSMGRHVHINYCRAEDGGPCDGAEVQHINETMTPKPNKPKDFITHGLYWHRMGFKDPYTRDEQTSFAKCDAMCSGPEHLGTSGSTVQPSYCTLPMFHPARNHNDAVNGPGYISNDGHLFECNNPVVMQQAYHVIFVVDRSSSMSSDDHHPLADAPMTDRIRQYADNRLGAAYSALYSFWHARHAATMVGRQTIGVRRDAYSVVLFSHATMNVLSNDFTSSPDQLLNAALACQTDSGTNFTAALAAGRAVMEQHWSTERAPVMIFLSDGECQVSDTTIQDLCRSAVRLGKPLSFHSVSFGPDSSSFYLRRMAELALEIQNNAPRDPRTPQAASVPSSFTVALDTVWLAETFLGIAESLRKPRGALMC